MTCCGQGWCKHMARGPGYSRLVRYLKIVLPMAAVVLLSTIFLIDQDRIDFDESLLGELPEGLDFEEGVLSPRLAGELADGTPYSLRAEFAVPVLSGYRLRDVTARVERELDPVEMIAAEGVYSGDDKQLTLSGGVDLHTQSGAQLVTDSAVVGLNDRSLSLPSPLELTSPGAQLRANSLRTEQMPTGDDIIWFEGDVRLSIDPDRMAEETE